MKQFKNIFGTDRMEDDLKKIINNEVSKNLGIKNKNIKEDKATKRK